MPDNGCPHCRKCWLPCTSWFYADGDMRCYCGRTYQQHSACVTDPSLNTICGGRHVKL